MMKTGGFNSEPSRQGNKDEAPSRESGGVRHRDLGGAVWGRLRAELLMLALGVGGDALLAQGGGDLRIVSFVQRGAEVELRLGFPTLWGRRYRVETSTNLLEWQTKVVTEPVQGASTAVVVKESGVESRFYRSSVFDWEELKAELQAARELWRTRGLDTYRFEFRWRFCNCHPDLLEWVRVDVRDKVLVGVTRLSTGEVLPPDRWSHRTVEGMFQWIEERLAQHPEVMRVRFDPVLGYPIEGYYDLTSMMADEEIGFELVSVLPP